MRGGVAEAGAGSAQSTGGEAKVEGVHFQMVWSSVGLWLKPGLSAVGAQSAGGMAAVKGVQVRTSGSQGSYVDLTNKWGSAWEVSNAPSYPLDVNIIGADGDSVRCLGLGYGLSLRACRVVTYVSPALARAVTAFCC